MVYRRQASSRLAALEEVAEGRTASHRREILHLQRLLSERQEAEERLLQSKREVEEELEVVWEAAIRENQQMKETLLDSRLTEDIHGLLVSTRASPVWPPPAAAENTSPYRCQPHSFGPHLLSSDRSPAFQRRVRWAEAWLREPQRPSSSELTRSTISPGRDGETVEPGPAPSAPSPRGDGGAR
ncbi:unnamed protein product [Pleuronectes platessa]|uniref:Uncharacterized protein n=1 Tax=Pleuronectes platessa TaxID=8262 RepID=A0A9N7VG99_PLEPL|nr:unnamed protein product [Pleuronectes platessa]